MSVTEDTMKRIRSEWEAPLRTEIERLREALTIAQYDGTKLQMITRALGAEPVDLQEGQSGWSPEFHGVMVLRAELKKRDDLARLVRTYKMHPEK